MNLSAIEFHSEPYRSGTRVMTGKEKAARAEFYRNHPTAAKGDYARALWAMKHDALEKGKPVIN